MQRHNSAHRAANSPPQPRRSGIKRRGLGRRVGQKSISENNTTLSARARMLRNLSLSAQPSPPRRRRRGVCSPVSQVCYCPKLGGQRDRRSRERAFLTRRRIVHSPNPSRAQSAHVAERKRRRFSKPVHTGSNPVVGSASERNTVRGLTVAQV